MLEDLKRHFAKSPAKTVTLAALTVVAVVFVFRALHTVSHAKASAAMTVANPSANDWQTSPGVPTLSARRKKLWADLLNAKTDAWPRAFTLDASAFHMDPDWHPKPKRRVVNLQRIKPTKGVTHRPNPQALIELIAAQAGHLHVQSIMLGGAGSAVINDQVLGCGDTIRGFKLVGIKSRAVEMQKDGETITVPMGQ